MIVEDVEDSTKTCQSSMFNYSPFHGMVSVFDVAKLQNSLTSPSVHFKSQKSPEGPWCVLPNNYSTF